MENINDLALKSKELVAKLGDTSGLEKFLLDHDAQSLDEFFTNADKSALLELKMLVTAKFEQAQAVHEANIYRKAINIYNFLIIGFVAIGWGFAYFFSETILQFCLKNKWATYTVLGGFFGFFANPFSTLYYKITKFFNKEDEEDNEEGEESNKEVGEAAMDKEKTA